MSKYQYRIYIDNRSFDVTQEAMTPSDGQTLLEAQYGGRVIWMGVA
jgi:hypothetical protein